MASNLLPTITPSITLTIDKLSRIEGISGTGVYVFWDNDRTKSELPLYIGKSYYSTSSMQDIGKRVSDHIKGNTHMKKYCMFFHTVDFYVFDLSRVDTKLASMVTTYGLNPEFLADIYEIYFIATMLPYFNTESNHHVIKQLHRLYFTKKYHQNSHRKTWLVPPTSLHLEYPHHQYCIKCGTFVEDVKMTSFDPNYICAIC